MTHTRVLGRGRPGLLLVSVQTLLVLALVPPSATGQERARVEVSDSFDVALGASEAFHLFEPEGERWWASGWDPQYPAGLPETPARGTVFRTSGEHETIWQIVQHDPGAGRISYSYVTPGRRVALIDVRVTGVSATTTRVHVSYAVTSLAEAEDEEVLEFEEGYADFLQHWARAIEGHLSRGLPPHGGAAAPGSAQEARICRAHDVIWESRAGGPEVEWVTSIDLFGDGAVAVSSLTTYGATSQQGWILKYGADGELAWERKLGGEGEEWAEFVQALPDGGVAAVGATDSEGAGRHDGWIFRLDGSGELLWEKILGGPGTDRIDAIVRLSDGGFLTSGDMTPEGEESFDAWVVRLDPDGTVLWDRHYGDDGRDEGRFIEALPNGGFAVAGLTTSKGEGNEDAWILRLAPDGTPLWDVTVGGPSLDRALELRETSDGGIVAVGISLSEGDPEDTDGLIFKVDAEGHLLWSRTLVREGEDNLWGLWPLPNGHILAVGRTDRGAGRGSDGWLVQVDGDGEVVAEDTCGGEGFDVLSGVQLLDDGSVVAGGRTQGRDGNPADIWILRLRPPHTGGDR